MNNEFNEWIYMFHTRIFVIAGFCYIWQYICDCLSYSLCFEQILCGAMNTFDNNNYNYINCWINLLISPFRLP